MLRATAGPCEFYAGVEGVYDYPAARPVRVLNRPPLVRPEPGTFVGAVGILLRAQRPGGHMVDEPRGDFPYRAELSTGEMRERGGSRMSRCVDPGGQWCPPAMVVGHEHDQQAGWAVVSTRHGGRTRA